MELVTVRTFNNYFSEVAKILGCIFLILSLIVLTSSCSFNTKNQTPDIHNIDLSPIPKDSNTIYFPQKKSSQDKAFNNNALDTFFNKWYSEMLFTLHEPVLYKYSGNYEIYRFTWLRTFHNPVVLRLEKQNDIIFLSVKKSNGAGGYKPGQITLDTIINVSTKGWNYFKCKIQNAQFWIMPTEVDNRGMDGSEWILEGAVKNNYHFVTRWTPTKERNAQFKDCCEYLIILSKLKISGSEKY